MTGRDLVTASLRLVGAVAPGESLAAQEATDGLASFNRMLSSWSTEGLIIYARQFEKFTLVSGQSTYTMGSGGNFNTTRPLKIDTALLRDETVNPAIEYELKILSRDEWTRIPAKDSTSTYPQCLFEDGNNPLTTIYLYPVPLAANKIVIWSSKELTSVATLDTTLAFPPGYEHALIHGFAIQIAPEYGRAVPESVMQTAIESKATIKRMNYRARYLIVDSLPTNQGLGKFNIYTGGTR